MRNTLIIGGICVLAIVAGVWLYVREQQPLRTSTQPLVETSPAPQAAASTTVPFTVLDHGLVATVYTARKSYVIYSAKEFAAFWQKVHGVGARAPSVDFTKQYVIAVFAGTEPTGGYDIKVSEITDTSDTRAVEVAVTAPGKSCVVNDLVTSPYEFLAVPASDAALMHTDVTHTTACP